ncbi:sialidase family protein [Parapedobacter deserti]|uniref:Sialidase family protein n=1 Tax=Parapedobacter deserti TaxID=1912957 RepID=A0ABV7JFD3_9SPHI
MAWPKAIKTLNGTIVLAYLAGQFHGSKGGHSPAVSVSKDKGRSFSDPRILKDFSENINYPESGNLAMGLAADGAIVLLAMAYKGNEANHIFGWRSEDDGETWEPVDTSALGPNKTGSVSGTIIQIPGNKLMVAGHYRAGSEPYQTGIWQSISDDGGKTWQKPEMITNINGGEPVLMRSGDRLLVLIRGREAGAVRQYLAVSEDLGKTWRLELTSIDAQNNHTLGLAHPFAMINPSNPAQLIALTTERPLPGSIWLWKGDVDKLTFELDSKLMDIPEVKAVGRDDYGYTWLVHLEGSHYLMFYYHGFKRGDNAIWVAEFDLPI